MSNYKVYVHINNVNGKMYVGQTCQKTLKNRFGTDGNQYKKCPIFWNAIKKYGFENFNHILLFDNLTKDMADIIEKEIIKKYNTTNRKFGYNLNAGGQNDFSYKRYHVYQYNDLGTMIKKWDSMEDIRDKLGYKVSSISRCCRNECKTYKGFIWSYKKMTKEEVKNKVKKNNIRGVRLYTKYCEYIKTYNSIKEASEDIGINYGTIQTACQYKGTIITNKQYRFVYDDEEIDIKNIKIKEEKEIEQYDLNGKYITTWDDISEIVGFNKNNVRECCKGHVKTAGKYIWKYGNDKKLKIENLDEYLKIYKQSKSKKVIQYTLNDNYIVTWESASIAAKKLGHNSGNNIRRCCNGEIKTCYGFKWKYENNI